MGLLIRILKFAQPLGGIVPSYVLLVALATVFSVINLTILIPLLQVLFDQVDGSVVSDAVEASFTVEYIKALFYQQLVVLEATKGKPGALYFLCSLVVGSVLLANLFRYISQLILAKVRVRVIQNMRQAAFHAILNLDLRFFTNTSKGDTISRVTSDIQDVEQSVVSSLKILIKEPFLIVGYLAALTMISLELTVYTLVLIPAAGFGVSLVARRIRKWATRSQESMGRISQVLDETFAGMRVVKSFNATAQISNRFDREVSRYANENFQVATKSNLSSPISEVVGVMVLVVILVIGGRMVLSEPPTLTASEFIGFLVIFSQMLNPAKAIAVCASQISKGLASAKRVFDLMEIQPSIFQSTQPKIKTTFSKSIHFRQVDFAYESQPVLKSIDFTIRKGEVVALVGPSGGGKSTIADLLSRFYDPSAGEIMIDEENLKDLALNEWRSLIALVSQEPILFHDSIANNIAFGQPSATKEQIEKVAKQAMAHDFIVEMEHGYNTNIGERGNRLSGGQKQRITIARALLKNPSILILDEATSSLDAQSEQLVQQAMTHLMTGRTTLLIAHRLSTTQHADKILVIDQGQIVEQGTHQELVSRKGLYKQLTRLQTF